MTPTTEEHWSLLRELSRPEGPLRIDAATATINWPDIYIAGVPRAGRRLLHAELLADVTVPEPAARPKVLMTAGPPGAGKSRIVQQELRRLNLDDNECLVVDPDAMKDRLLRHLVSDGTYENRLLPKEVRAAEAEGHRFFPREMAALVHEESSQLAKDLLRTGMEVGCNIVLDGVMANLASADATLRRLATAVPNFAVTVMCIETSQEASRQRVKRRWLRGYEAAMASLDEDQGSHQWLGGRFVPSEVNETIFKGPGPSVPVRVAHDLVSSHEVIESYRFFVSSEDEGPDLVLSEDRAGGWVHLGQLWERLESETPNRSGGR